MAIKYTNISDEEYYNLSSEEIKIKPYCIEFSDGDKHWLLNGQFHREDGPAIEYSDGDKVWYLKDYEYSFEEWLKKLDIIDEEKIFLRIKYS